MAAELHSSSVASRKWGRASRGSTRAAAHFSRSLPLRLMTSKSSLRQRGGRKGRRSSSSSSCMEGSTRWGFSPEVMPWERRAPRALPVKGEEAKSQPGHYPSE